MLKQRFVEIQVGEDWQVRTYAAVKEGMVFKLYDSDGSMVETPDGSGELLAIADAQKEEDYYSIDFIYNN